MNQFKQTWEFSLEEGAEPLETVTRKLLLPGVWLTAVHTKKFKTGYFSLHLLTPLSREDAAPNALLPFVLRRGTYRNPDLQSISQLLLELYGGVVEPSIRKRGAVQAIGFAASFLDDAYAGGTPVASQAIGLLGDLLLRPNTRNGRFRAEYVESEKKNLIAMIQSQINDKRSYALQRLIEEMYAGEALGVNRLGSVETLEKLNNQKLYQRWNGLIKASPIELYYCGSAPFRVVAEAWKEALTGLPRVQSYSLPETSPFRRPREVRRFDEHLNVTQGKLVMGFDTGIDLTSPQYPALLVMNAAFGGSTNSRLFLNVREKLSLCYYASSVVDKHSGLLAVSSGVEFGNVRRAEEEILAQLSAIAAGELSEEEFISARKYVTSNLRAMNDNQGQLESFLFSQNLGGLEIGPGELALLCGEVTPQQVQQVAGQVLLDSVYVLSGLEGQEVSHD